MKTLLKILSAICLAVVLIFALIAAQIYFYDENAEGKSADAAIVLGAAVWGERLSPVFEERVNHAIELYRAGRIRKIVFTGGQGNSHEETEAAAAKRYALAHGVPAEDILLEDRSTSTYENLLLAQPIARDHGIRTVFLVSDPLHMKRSMAIAESLKFEASPSPTPTTRYRSLNSQLNFLTRETYYYSRFLLSRILDFGFLIG